MSQDPDPLLHQARKEWQRRNPLAFRNLQESGKLGRRLREARAKAKEHYALAVEAGLDPVDSEVESLSVLYGELDPSPSPDPVEQEFGESLNENLAEQFFQAPNPEPTTQPETSTPKR